MQFKPFIQSICCAVGWLSISTLLLPATSLATTPVSQQLLDAIAAQGNVQVLVGLDIPFTPEGDLTAAEVAAQRATITDTQTTFNTELVDDLIEDGLIDFPTKGPAPDLIGTRFTSIPYVRMEVNTESLPYLQNSDNINSIKLEIIDVPALGDRLALTGVDLVHQAGFNGAGQTIVMLDSGSHIRSDLEACFSSTGCPNGQTAQIGWGAAAPCHILRCEHGSLVGLVTQTFAPAARIIPVQVASSVFGSVGYRSTDQIQALEYVYDLQQAGENITAVNLSFGSGQFSGVCNPAESGNQDARLAVIQNLVSQGIAVVAASGNAGYQDALYQPACYAEVISVGATDESGAIWADTNRSPVLDLLAPGADITLTLPSGETLVDGGTSLAAPMVTAGITLLKAQQPDLTVAAALAQLKATADSRSGFPQVQLDKALDIQPAGCNGSVKLPANLCQDLVAYYPLDGNASDASGNGNDGTEYNVNYSTGVVGNALALEGTGYIRKADFNLTAEDLSISLWAYADNLPNNSWGRHLFALHSGANARNQGDKGVKMGWVPNGQIHPTLTTSDGQTGINRPISTMSAGQWQHLTFVRHAGDLQKLYINGVLVDEVTEQNIEAQLVLENAFLEIGAPNYYEGGWAHENRQTKWVGLLDEMYVFKRSLTDAEIQTLYTTNSPNPEPQPFAYYCFDDPNNIGNNCSSDENHIIPNANVSTAAGKVGQALLLDEEYRYIDISNVNTDFMATGMTLATWFKPNESMQLRGVTVWSQDGQLPIGITIDATEIDANVWNCAVYTYDVANNYALQLFLNGVKVGEQNLDLSFIPTPSSIGRITVDDGGVERNFNGLIDEALLYNYPLAEADIKTLCSESAQILPDTLTLTKQGYGISRAQPSTADEWTINCSVSCQQDSHHFSLGTGLLLTAYPQAGNIFQSWQCDNGLSSDNNRWTFTLDQPTTCTATFAPVEDDPQYPSFSGYSIGTGNGTLSIGNLALGSQGQVNYPFNRIIWVKAEPTNALSQFKQWSGDCTGSKPQVKVVMDSDKSCYAEFSSASAEVGGDIVAQLYRNPDFARQYPQMDNESCLRQAMNFAMIAAMDLIESHLHTKGTWPIQLNGIELYAPPPVTENCTHSLKIVTDTVDSHLQVQVYLLNASGATELVNMQTLPPADGEATVTDWLWRW